MPAGHQIIYLLFFVVFSTLAGLLLAQNGQHRAQTAPPTLPPLPPSTAPPASEQQPIDPPMWPDLLHHTTPPMPPFHNYSASYLVIAPKIVRPGLPYAVSVNILRSAEPDHIVRVEIRDSKNETMGARVVSNFRTGMPQTVAVENLSEESFLVDEDYRVYVKAETISSKTIFEDSARVQCSPKSVSIFVQTDKAIYKPGTTVHYRILVVTPDLLPYTEPVSVHVDDPSQNRIANMPKLQLRKGVHTGELQLSTEPPLGNWQIHVQTAGGVKFAKEFNVDRYVLPKFEVNIKTPSFITINDDLTIQLSAKYTYGKGVAGKAKVRLDLPFPRWSPQQLHLAVEGGSKLDEVGIERSVKLNGMGEATLTFDNSELRTRKIIMDWGGSTIQVVAEVTEELTEVQRNATVELTAYSRDVKLEVDKQSDTFKPGLPFGVVVALKQMDDTPAKSSLPRRVQLTTFYQFRQSYRSEVQDDKEVKVLELDAHGTAMLQLLPPLNCTNARVEASYDRSGQNNFTNSPIYTSLYVEAGRSPSQAFLQVNADNQGVVDAGKTLSFSVKCTEPLSSFTYQVVARGVVVLSEQVSLGAAGDNAQQMSGASLTFIATPQMAPKSRLVVYAIRELNKEILVDAIDFKVDGLFRNNVTLSVDRLSAEPGDPVRFRVRAAPDSFVGLLAVDQSVLLLKSGNDITKELVEQDVEEYDTTSNSGTRMWTNMRRGMVDRRRRSTWSPWWGVGGKDASSVFENAGLVVLTDAYLFKEPEPVGPWHYQRPVFARMRASAGRVVNGAVPGMAGPPPPPTSKLRQPESLAAPAAPVMQQRKHFPEAWIWADIATTSASSENGEVVYDAKAPDTITQWVASAFAINEQAGLGLAPAPVKLKVFRPFFVRLELPYSVKRNEKMALQVLVFNYLENEQEVTVTLKHQPGFDFLQKDGTSLKKGKTDKSYNMRYVLVPGGVSRAVYFPIVFTDVGQLRLHVVAQADQAADALEQTLRVEPEGYRVDRNVPLIVDLTTGGQQQQQQHQQALPPAQTSESVGDQSPATPLQQPLHQQQQQQQQQAVVASPNGAGGGAAAAVPTAAQYRKVVELQFPADHVIGSRKARVDFIGDIMGPVLSNVDSLVRMPYGCGEQNMVTLVPNIVVMRYLRATQRANPSLELKAKKFMESGYQRELTYRRPDNSFSAFGESDHHGSTWLTAFVIRSFKQAQAYIFVDERVLEDSIAFLISQQQDNGAFAERGEVHNKLMQGGASEGGFTLTAYVLVALLENHVQNRVTERARNYLELHLHEFKEDPYALALCAYVLHLANSPKKGEVLKTLEGLQLVGPTDGTVHWTTKTTPNGGAGKDGTTANKGAGTARDSNQYFFQSQPADIEMSAYALLTYMLLDDKEHAAPIVRWLTAQRNSLGGFSSTQDTVMALQSLGAYAEKAYSPSFNLSLKVQNGQDTHSFSITAQNALVLQSYELPNLDAPVELEAVGTSVAFVQVQYSYHRQTLRDDVPFYCSKDVREVRNGNRLQLELCCNYTRAGARSNMAVAEVDALSGYRFDEEDVRRLTGIADLQRVELDKEDSKLNIYFNPLGDVPVCLSLNTDLVYQIADQREAQLLLYDYYDPQQQMKSTYSARLSRSLEESCPDCWPDPNAHASRAQSTRPSNGGAGSSTGAAAPSPAVLFLLLFSVGLQLLTTSSLLLLPLPLPSSVVPLSVIYRR